MRITHKRAGKKMRVTSLKSIYLTEKELKQAIADWIKAEHNNVALADHFMNDTCDMSWDSGGDEFIISIDNEFVDDPDPTTEG